MQMHWGRSDHVFATAAYADVGRCIARNAWRPNENYKGLTGPLSVNGRNRPETHEILIVERRWGDSDELISARAVVVGQVWRHGDNTHATLYTPAYGIPRDFIERLIEGCESPHARYRD